MRLNFPHRLAIVDVLATLRTGVVFKVRHHIGLAFHFASPVPPNLFFKGTVVEKQVEKLLAE
jgi:hypothetical protein